MSKLKQKPNEEQPPLVEISILYDKDGNKTESIKLFGEEL